MRQGGIWSLKARRSAGEGGGGSEHGARTTTHTTHLTPPTHSPVPEHLALRPRPPAPWSAEHGAAPAHGTHPLAKPRPFFSFSWTSELSAHSRRSSLWALGVCRSSSSEIRSEQIRLEGGFDHRKNENKLQKGGNLSVWACAGTPRLGTLKKGVSGWRMSVFVRVFCVLCVFCSNCLGCRGGPPGWFGMIQHPAKPRTPKH